jgi:hypothetical protein
MHSRAVIRTVNYSIIRIIKLTVTVRRIFALFEEFNVGFSTFLTHFQNNSALSNSEVRNVPQKTQILTKVVHFNHF